MSEVRKWRVVSDGTVPGTHVYDPDGKDVTKGLTSVAFEIDATHGLSALATVTLNAECDVLAEKAGAA